MIEFNFKSQIATTIEQSQRLLAIGLKKETADMSHTAIVINHKVQYMEHCSTPKGMDIPAWSLHRLIEILDTNPCVFYTNCGYDNIIDRIEDYIKEGIIDTRYLQEWCLNEEE